MRGSRATPLEGDHDRNRRPPLDGQLRAGAESGDAGRDRGGFDRGAVRADPRRPPAGAAAEPACRTSLGSLPQAAPNLAAEPHRELRAESQFPGCRLLATPCAGRRRRDRRPLRAADQRLGLAAIRLRPQPGLVRICQPAGRAGRHGGGLAAGLLLGLCGRPRHPHGRADHRAPRGAVAARARPRAAGGDRQLLRAARDEPAHRHRPGRIRSGNGPARLGRARAQALERDRRGVRREPVLPRPDRGARCRNRQARPSARRPTDRRRRPDLPGRPAGAGRLGCGHRGRARPSRWAST